MHNYIADFDSEHHLYIRSMRLLQQLAAWEPSPLVYESERPLCACIEELWVMMYEHDYIQIGDITLMHAWLQSLVFSGYKFPKLARVQSGKQGHTLLQQQKQLKDHNETESRGRVQRQQI